MMTGNSRHKTRFIVMYGPLTDAPATGREHLTNSAERARNAARELRKQFGVETEPLEIGTFNAHTDTPDALPETWQEFAKIEVLDRYSM